MAMVSTEALEGDKDMHDFIKVHMTMLMVDLRVVGAEAAGSGVDKGLSSAPGPSGVDVLQKENSLLKKAQSHAVTDNNREMEGAPDTV